MSTKINIKGENTFEQSPIITGHNNTVIIQGTDHEIDWKLWQNELIDVSGKLPESSDEYAASKEALKYSLNKDKEGLTKVLKKNAASFMSDMFKGVASGTLVRLILEMVG